MSHPSTPYAAGSGNGQQDLFESAILSLHQTEALASWSPPAPFSVTPDTNGHIVPELVVAVGTATNNRRFFYFESLYDEFLARGGDEVDVLKSFIKALTFRRTKGADLLASVLKKIFQSALLDAEDWEDLAGIVSDLGSKPLVEELMRHAKIRSVQHRPCFYSHIMRFAAEQLASPDFDLIMTIVDAMGAVRAAWTESSMYHLLGGFCRLKDSMPYETLLHIVRAWCVARTQEDADAMDGVHEAHRGGEEGSPFPTSVMSRIVSLCERALGQDAVHAKALLELLGTRESWGRCIEAVQAPLEFEKPPPSEDCVFYLIDPLSIDVTLLGEPQPRCYYMFLFSTLRALCERATLHQETHNIYTSKIHPIRKLFRAYPCRVAVVPVEIELAIRTGTMESSHGTEPCSPSPSTHANICPKCLASTTATPPGDAGAPHECSAPGVLASNGGIAQLIYFAKCAMALHCQVGRSLMVVTTNPTVMKELCPLTQRFSSSWFGICDHVTTSGARDVLNNLE